MVTHLLLVLRLGSHLNFEFLVDRLGAFVGLAVILDYIVRFCSIKISYRIYSNKLTEDGPPFYFKPPKESIPIYYLFTLPL